MSAHGEREDECWEIATLTAEKDAGLWAVAAGLFAIAHANYAAAKHLGNGDAMTSMGAIEALGKHLGEHLQSIAAALDNR